MPLFQSKAWLNAIKLSHLKISSRFANRAGQSFENSGVNIRLKRKTFTIAFFFHNFRLVKFCTKTNLFINPFLQFR